MSLAVSAEYQEDGDQLIITAYVKIDNKYTVKIVESGVCECRWNGQTVQSLTFDKNFGNVDGCFKFVFSHPVVRTPQVYVRVTLKDTTVLETVTQSYVVGETSAVLSANT